MFDQVEAFYRPGSVSEALRLLEKGRGRARVVAGGTDVVVEGGGSVRYLIDLTRAGLSYIRRRDSVCVIGAATVLAELEDSTAMRALAGGLVMRAAAACGSVQNRNRATVGGNLAQGSPASDMAPALLVLEAVATVADARGRHKMTVGNYLERVQRKTMPNTLLVEIAIPEPPQGSRCGWSFQKFGRTEVDIAIVNAAAGLELDASGKVKWARLAVGAASPVAFRAYDVEERLAGHNLDQRLLASACEQIQREVRPIDDVRASAEFRRELSRVLAVRALEECATQAGCTL